MRIPRHQAGNPPGIASQTFSKEMVDALAGNLGF